VDKPGHTFNDNNDRLSPTWNSSEHLFETPAPYVPYYRAGGALSSPSNQQLTDPRPQSNGLLGRLKRFAMIVAKNIVKYVAVSEAPNDPAGDDDPSATCYKAMLKAWKEVSVEVSA
jgi:hypothetical protein